MRSAAPERTTGERIARTGTVGAPSEGYPSVRQSGALGVLFGWSKTRANEVLHQLQYAGRVRLSTSSQGTMVRLVAGTA